MYKLRTGSRLGQGARMKEGPLDRTTVHQKDNFKAFDKSSPHNWVKLWFLAALYMMLKRDNFNTSNDILQLYQEMLTKVLCH